MKKLILLAAAFALAVANAASFKVDLPDSSMIKGTPLKAGTYKIEIKDKTAVITSGRIKIEAPVTIQNTERKFPDTRVVYEEHNGQRLVREIYVGGTNTRIVFDNEGPVTITR